MLGYRSSSPARLRRGREDVVRYPKDRVYHLFDNVSEMTMEVGTAMGANNLDLTAPTSNLDRRIIYDAPHYYLGFRCVADVE